MRFPGIVVALLCVGGWALGATLEVPGQYSTIQAAIDAAAAGDTVKIAAGTYNENLTLKSGVSLAGESRDTTAVKNYVDRGGLVTVTGCAEPVQISGITFEHLNKERGERRRHPDLLSITDSKAVVRDCAFRNGGGHGIYIEGTSDCEVRGCLSEGNARSGIALRYVKGDITLTSNECLGNAEDGIIVWGSKAKLAGNTCGNNAGSGVCISESDVLATLNKCTGNGRGMWIDASSFLLESNTCESSGTSGIYVCTGSKGTAVGNQCRENGDSGILATSLGTVCDAFSNTCSKNGVCGITYICGAQGHAKENTCEENGEAGFNVARWRSRARFENNKALNNEGSGIRVWLNSTAEIVANECRGNKDCGILIADEGSSAEESGNTAEDNPGGGVVRREGLPLNRQYWIRKEEAGRLLKMEAFDAIEQFMVQLREHKPRPPDGPLELERFYTGLQEGYGIGVDEKEEYAALLDRWAAAYPDSATPLIVRAQAEIHYAWDSRGTGWADETTREGRQAFKAHLQNAERLLRQAESKSGKDAHLYALLIEVARGLSYDRNEVDDAFQKGLALDPWHMPLYEQMVWCLAPRWHGEPGEMEAFVEKVGEDGNAEIGSRMYAYAAAYACIYLDADTGFSWERIDKGFSQLEEEYPECWLFLNCHCHLACLYGERALAKELFERTGNNLVEHAWNGDEDAWRAYKKWAYGGDDYPVVEGQTETARQRAREEFRTRFGNTMRTAGLVMFAVVGVVIALIVVAKGRG